MPLINTSTDNPFTGDGDFLLTSESEFSPLPKPGSWMIMEVSGEFGTAYC